MSSKITKVRFLNKDGKWVEETCHDVATCREHKTRVAFSQKLLKKNPKLQLEGLEDDVVSSDVMSVFHNTNGQSGVYKIRIMPDGSRCLSGDECVRHGGIEPLKGATPKQRDLETNMKLLPIILDPERTNKFRMHQAMLNEERSNQEEQQFVNLLLDLQANNPDIPLEELYRTHLIENPNLSKGEILFYAGLNEKTVKNEHGSVTMDILRATAAETFEAIMSNDSTAMSKVYETENGRMEIPSKMVPMFNRVIIARGKSINGGANSSRGKNLEVPICESLFKAAGADSSKFSSGHFSSDGREIDFTVENSEGKLVHIEVKIIGVGNPENIDAAHARETSIVLTQNISSQHKNGLTNKDIEFIDLADPNYPQMILSALKKHKVTVNPPKKFDVDYIKKSLVKPEAI
jgi:hypothetical protein